MNSLKHGKQIKIVKDQYNNPTCTVSIAKVIHMCIKRELEGILHWGDSDYVNRFEFAKMITEKYDLNSSLIEPILTKDLNQLAQRPKQSGLNTDKVVEILDVQPPSIDYCLSEIVKRDNL